MMMNKVCACLLFVATVTSAYAEEELTPEEWAEINAALSQDTKAEEPKSVPAESGLTAGSEMNPSLALIADFALAYFSDQNPIQRGGHDPTAHFFNLQQLELSAQAAVDPYLKFDANLVFSLFGVEIEEVYGTTLALPWNLQARVGQFLTRFGRINASHPHSWDFVDQTLVIGKFFGSEGQRGLGAELSLLLPLPWYVEIMASTINANGGATNRSFLNNDNRWVETPDALLAVTTIKQFFPLSQNWSLFFGLSGAFGPNNTGRDNRSEIYGADLYLKWRPITYGSYSAVSLQTEWMLRQRQIPQDVLQDFGGYAQVFWRFDRRWTTGVRYEFLSGLKGDVLDPEQDDREHKISSALTFFPTEFSRLRLQYAAHIPQYRDDPLIHTLFCALELVAGAHGSHAF